MFRRRQVNVTPIKIYKISFTLHHNYRELCGDYREEMYSVKWWLC